MASNDNGHLGVRHNGVIDMHRTGGLKASLLRAAGISAATVVSAFFVSQLALAAAQYPRSPQQLFGDLFVAVQKKGILDDNKEFVDAIPKSSPSEILALYNAEHPQSQTALKKFVSAHFILPSDTPPQIPIAGVVPIKQHITSLWDLLTRQSAKVQPYSSLLPLPYPYVVPGGRFREVYYWDSYFTMLGLFESGRKDLVEDMVRDFAYLIDQYGHIPNGNRTYYLTRSQPPFFFKMVELLASGDPAKAFARYLPELKTEYRFWMDGEGKIKPGMAHRRVVAMPDGAILNRYWDDNDLPRDESYRKDLGFAKVSKQPEQQTYRNIRAAAESGWDFSSRWFADSKSLSTIDTTEIVPIDLNSLLFGLENAIRLGCERAGDKKCARDFVHRASLRRAAIDRYLWNRKNGIYSDYRWTQRLRIDHVSAAALYPLFFGVADDRRAKFVSEDVEKELLKPGGLATTTLNTGQQWDLPNGWAPLQWIAIAGLNRYHQTRLAETIACRWMVNVANIYRKKGKLVEKYDVVEPARPGGGGEYPLQDGFGWTNGVMLKLMALYPADTAYTSAEQCPKGRNMGHDGATTPQNR